MRRSSKILKVFLYLALVVLGLVAGWALSHYHSLPLSQEINLIDLATLVVTIFLAVYVPAVLDRQLQTVQDRKRILEERIVDYQALQRRINMYVQDEEALKTDTYLTIMNLLDVSGHRLETLASLIKNSGLDKSLNNDIADVIQVNEDHKALFSGLDKSAGATYPESLRNQEELLYNKLDEATSLMIFKISNTY
jgi:hypothetical protein